MEKKLEKRFRDAFPHTTEYSFEDAASMLLCEDGEDIMEMAQTFFNTRLTEMIKSNYICCLTQPILDTNIEDALIASIADAHKFKRMDNFLAEYLEYKIKNGENEK